MNFLNDKILINQIDNVAISGLTTQLISFCVNDIYKRNNKNKRKKEQIESDICHITTREDTLIHLLTHRQGIVSYKIRIIV